MSKESIASNRTAAEMAEKCGNSTVMVSRSIMWSTPGYPNGYADNLHCNWIVMPSNPSRHVVVSILRIDLEEFGDCDADYLRISSSNDLVNWQEKAKICKKETDRILNYDGTPYVKMEFVTDSGVNKTGVSSMLKTACGSEMTAPRAFINVTEQMKGYGLSYFEECVWKIKVALGRRIRIRFVESILHDPSETNNECRSYFMLRNGMAVDSPFLGQGKYCGNNITDVLETSSNRVFIKFVRSRYRNLQASFVYEEILHECSQEIRLDDEIPGENLKTISTPNYPNIPNPHSECIWKIMAPAHHVIAIDFGSKFDLVAYNNNAADKNSSCQGEYVQINDGATELMPSLGVYCGNHKPDTKYSSGNVLRVKYYSDVSEPHMGFTANVSIGRCGGSYYSPEGIIESPKNFKFHNKEKEYECVYIIEMEHGNTINLTLEEMSLPEAQNCSTVTHLELHEIDVSSGVAENVSDVVLLCGDYKPSYLVETNKIIIRYIIKDLSSEPKFRLSYKAIGARCGATIEASVGILTTPNYPSGVQKPTHCFWYIQVPKGKVVKLEILDYDTGGVSSNSIIGPSMLRPRMFRGRMAMYNDFKMHSLITRTSETVPAEVLSTDNKMAIDAFLLGFAKHRGFKLRFTGYLDSTHCRNQLSLSEYNTPKTYLFESKSNDSSIYCEYDLDIKNKQTVSLHISKVEYYEGYSRIFGNSMHCEVMPPFSMETDKTVLLPKLICGNFTETDVRLSAPTTLKFSSNKFNLLKQIELQYTVYPCGGRTVVHSAKTIQMPSLPEHAGRLECAWYMGLYDSYDVDDEEDSQFEVTLTVDFKASCEKQYLLLYNGPDQNSPHLGRYCTQSSASNLVVQRGLYFEYVTDNYEQASSFNLSIAIGTGCGGKLSYPFQYIAFNKQYINNVECIWELETDVGYHIDVVFKEYFYIESSTNCINDYLKIQQKNSSNEWEDIATLCGRNPPKFLNSTSSQLRLIFHSNEAITGDGFYVTFDRNCGGLLYATDEVQTFTSPGYPDKYDNNLYCNWTILAKEKEKSIVLNFVVLDVERTPFRDCLFDNVTIINYGKNSVDKAVKCGKLGNQQFISTRKIEVIMASDNTYGAKGIEVQYSTSVCGGLISRPQIIESPKTMSDQLPPNSNCYWNITAPSNQKILVKFLQLDYESSMDCTFDKVEVFKSLIPSDDARMGLFCGNLSNHIPIISIPSNNALIRTSSDERDPSKGFKAIISFAPECDTRIYLDDSNATYEFNAYAGSYANDLHCNHIFDTSPGRQLHIQFKNFHMEDSENCNADYLEIIDGAGPFGDKIGQFCGHDIPMDVVVSRNHLMLRFVSDSMNTSTGFSATVKSIEQLCGNPAGEIRGDEVRENFTKNRFF